MTRSTTSKAQPAAPAGDAPRLTVLGTGYLGATHAVAMAELGFDVTGVDTDQAKVDALQAGKVPFYEPGLPELLEKNLATGRLRFTTDVASAVAQGDVHFVCVGTPQQRTSHAANLAYVEAATTAVARHLTKDAVIVGKSTVPVGTAARLRELVAREAPAGVDVELVWNPEFLREGKAVGDTLHPDRIVLGGVSARSEAVLRTVYATPIAEGSPVVVTDLPTAELVKVSANAFLATKISFINAIAGVCEAAGADVTVLADALGHDVRIGRQFLDAGLGFGGGCLPKDIRALMHRANELGAHRAAGLLQQVDEINMGQRERVIDMALEACGGSVLNRRIGVLGAAFKPLTDDVRDSPALNVAAALHLRGAQVTVYDPEAGDTARRLFPTLSYATSVDEAVEGADVVLVLTEWDQFLGEDPARLAPLTHRARVIDARGKLSAEAWRTAGWDFTGLGRAAA
ncbi:UDP-glucose/GDP-mannose dehydrogenase family protein [Cellulomonas sp. zg-ZUI222]|uniref:UDP-glucose 6-dehydrogenase n=1 Tax=Cellulomonas wangleii TaxID=2816956 RepID=A0ABX8D581_9CELL|nr:MULTISPECIES: UDP-glucose/GDP-mannose dehydrogenase family protein [Cellulomonas]MBO0899043.1 UDP-glucose/GDP-mannose dehydrogenase family protein [Cellulomonas sp. zg-ZUI22]MBO0919896.1 UDP-glucose/GDP-mannose dehydrogenase family protein [Cellulomonas wangleii]MBO0923675.1 UDP-glucose/GDP-mannose dehydrogenase family protein [Cellulomonas wangleii]QVI61990.1 UDP-glucose/GDP-mannose dehydrogenase family protein [Cellulomonas wangleii]